MNPASSDALTKRRPTAIGILAIVLLAVVMLTWWARRHDAARSAALAVPERMDAEHLALAGEAARNAAEPAAAPSVVESAPVREGGAPAPPPSTVTEAIEILGRLPRDQVDRLRDDLGVRESAVKLAQARTRAESGKVPDYQDYLHAKQELEMVLVTEAMIRDGTYVTTAEGKPPPVAEGFEMLGRMRAAQIDGKWVDVWFLIDLHHRQGAGVQQAIDAIDEFESRRLDASDWRREDEDVRKFNKQDFAVRKARIEASQLASQQLRDWPQDHSRLSPEALAIRAKLLPGKFVVEQATFTVRKRLQARY